MFEIGFSEIVVIMVVALIVIGPEKLPKVARTLGLLWGRAQRYVNGVRADIERDMQLEELRQLKLKMEQEAMAVEQATKQTVQTLDQHVQSLEVPSEPAPAVESKPRSVPAATPDSKPKPQAAPIQQQFPID
jgi:sec-independent protein translocase protein TatB